MKSLFIVIVLLLVGCQGEDPAASPPPAGPNPQMLSKEGKYLVYASKLKDRPTQKLLEENQRFCFFYFEFEDPMPEIFKTENSDSACVCFDPNTVEVKPRKAIHCPPPPFLWRDAQ
jgi:hypothetical protein